MIKDSSKSSKAVTTFFNSDSGRSENVETKIVSDDSGSTTFACEGDTAVYNMAYEICDGIPSIKFDALCVVPSDICLKLRNEVLNRRKFLLQAYKTAKSGSNRAGYIHFRDC